MFTQEKRTAIIDWLRELAQADPRVTAGALIGSLARGGADAWSDVDMTFGIASGISLVTVLDEWTAAFAHAFGVLDHFDLHSQSSVYRVLLLADGLEVDVSVTPERDFAARSPHFHLLFGVARPFTPTAPSEPEPAVGLCWHHVIHARSSIERGRLWQAEYWISALRDHTLEMTCLRLGENPAHGRGFDRLPAAVTHPFREALVRDIDKIELRRALAAATICYISELTHSDPGKAHRLAPVLREIGGNA